MNSKYTCMSYVQERAVCRLATLLHSHMEKQAWASHWAPWSQPGCAFKSPVQSLLTIGPFSDLLGDVGSVFIKCPGLALIRIWMWFHYFKCRVSPWRMELAGEDLAQLRGRESQDLDWALGVDQGSVWLLSLCLAVLVFNQWWVAIVLWANVGSLWKMTVESFWE